MKIELYRAKGNYSFSRVQVSMLREDVLTKTQFEKGRHSLKKIKNEAALLKKALFIAEGYAKKRGYNGFSPTDPAKHKIESLYRLLVQDKLITALPEDKEDLASLKRRLVVWIMKQLPKDHELLQ